jgi:hypothetical protein
MTSRTIVSGFVGGLLLSIAANLLAADAPSGKRGANQTVARSTNVSPPKLTFSPVRKSAAAKVTAGILKLNPQPEPPGNPRLVATEKAAARQLSLPSHAERLSKSKPSSSKVLQLRPGSDPASAGRKVLTLVKEEDQKVLRLVTKQDPPAEIMQFGTENESGKSATILPLGTQDDSEPAATLLQFDSSDD